MRRPTRQEIEEIMLEIEARGELFRTGEFRNGQPVFALTEKGKAFGDAQKETKH
jgi:hypothetical protein